MRHARRSAARRSGRHEGLRACPPMRHERGGRREGGSNSVVESQPSKLLVAGSIPVSRSILRSPLLHFRSELRPGKPGSRRRAKAPVGGTLACGWLATPRLCAAQGRRKADVAQLAERVLGKDEVTSSILVIGSRLLSLAAPAS